MRLRRRLAARPPRHTGMRHGLEGAGLVLAPDREPQAAPPACRPAQSTFFGHRIGIADAHHTGACACASPRPVSHQVRLSASSGRPHARCAAERADPGSPSGAGARLAAAGSRPSRRAVRWRGPRAHSARTRSLRISAIADPWSAPMAGPHGGEPVAVEPADPGRRSSRLCRRPTWWAAAV